MAQPTRVGWPALRNARVSRWLHPRASPHRVGRAASRLPSPVVGALSAKARIRLFLALAGILVAGVDLYTVSLAMPDIMAGVGVSPGDLHRGVPMITTFLVGYASMLLLAGRLAELWGTRRVMLLSLGAYAAGSVCAATAESLAPFLTGRVLQGFAAGALVPTTLAMVNAWWPAELRGYPRRLVVGAQDAAIVVGPLLGAGLLATSHWRAVFWLDFLIAGAIAWALVANDDPVERRRRPRLDRAEATLGWAAAVAFLLVLLTPDVWRDSSVLGWAYDPLVGSTVLASPLAFATALTVVALVARDLCVPGERRALLDLRRVSRLTQRLDVAAAGLLALTIGLLVAAPAAGDPAAHPLGGATPYLLALAVLTGAATVWRARRAPLPLVAPGTVGSPGSRAAVAVSALVGTALVATVVYVPLFSYVTRDQYSHTGAALVLLRLLVLVPVGTFAGGFLLLPFSPRAVASTGLTLAAGGLVAMTRWDAGSLRGTLPTLALCAVGLGLGLALRPIAALVHRSAPKAGGPAVLAVLMTSRVAGMAVGLGALTALGAAVYYARMAGVLSPDELCPSAPAQCAEYEQAVRSATVDQMRAVFAGAAACATAGAVLALVMFRARPWRTPAS